MKKELVYIAMSADFIHPGHLKIIEEGSKLGEVMIGLLTDSAIVSYKKMPHMEYKDRYKIIDSLKNVKHVVKQETHDYVPNLKKFKPKFVLHGNDWKTGIQKKIRERAIKTIKRWNGKLIEIPYSYEFDEKRNNSIFKQISTTPVRRVKALRRLIETKKILKFLDIHNALSALIVEKTNLTINGKFEEYDGMWASSLTTSTAKGKPDIEAVDSSERLQSLSEVLEVTTKPLIYDGDTGGKPEHFTFMVKNLERLGISAVIIEDKKGLKKNSLFGKEVYQEQDSIKSFSEKISEGKKAQATEDFMIIARIESFILNKGLEDAIKRAKRYIKAGADGIMIHSRKKDPQEIFNFCKKYNKFKNRKPLIVVPSSFGQIKIDTFVKHKIDIIIYANHLMRSVYPSMVNTAKSILKNKRSLEIEKKIMPIKEILELIPGTK